MVKRTIVIDDDLDETVDRVKQEVLEDFIEFINANPDLKDFDVYYQNKGCEFVHTCCDDNTPIYNSDIDGLYYLYGDDFEEAFENAGVEDGKNTNHRQIAIYCYLSDNGFEIQREIEEKFKDWKAEDKPRPLKEFIEELKELV